MLIVNNIHVQYGDRILLDEISFSIGMRERVGLVGKNGAGKSTILKLIAGDQTPDSGAIERPSNSTVAYLHQDIRIEGTKTLIEEVRQSIGELAKVEARLAKITKEMETRTDFESQSYHDLIDDFTHLNDQFLLMGGNEIEAEIEKILRGLGFSKEDFEKTVNTFSGGWQMRIELTKMLLQKPSFLLLDEPTNHLDIESIIWLEEFLQSYPSTVILISHDQQFLDNVTKRTIEIELGRIHDYKVPYSKYLIERKERKIKQIAAYNNQQKVIEEKQRTINRFMAKATKTKMAQSMAKQLDKIERVEIEQEDVSQLKIRFPEPPRSGELVLKGEHISKSYGSKTVLVDANIDLFRGDRVSFVGQNGQGKTTLAEILIGKRTEDTGKTDLGYNVHVGYYAQNQAEVLNRDFTLLQTMEANSPAEMRPQLRKILGAFMFSGEDADKKVSVLSGGERARLALACLLLKPINLLILDEPTNHLDMLSKEVLKNALMDFSGTLLIVSHDREFLKGLTNKTIEFKDHSLHTYLGDVEYFLEKRRLQNMRDVEIVKDQKISQAEQNSKPVFDPISAEKKKLQKQIEKLEKEIHKQEQKKDQLEQMMAEIDFYQQDNSAEKIQEHQKIENSIQELTRQWEKLVEQF
jgi:ATP-binding cassette subfamily F protein 3